MGRGRLLFGVGFGEAMAFEGGGLGAGGVLVFVRQAIDL